MRKRALIVALSVGGGHGKAGEVVGAALRELAPDWEVRCVDLRDYMPKWFRTLYVAGYLFIVRHLPWIWGFLYKHPPNRKGGTMPGWLLSLVIGPFERLVREFDPDVILATQVTASEAINRLRARGVYHGAAATVLTDLDAHPVWRADHIDAFFVPDEAVREGLVALGFAPDHVEATGIPIDPAFEQPFDAAALKAKHDVRPCVPVVLMMGGSLGLGPIEDVVRRLLGTGQPLDLLVIAGHNQALRQRLERIDPTGQSRLRVLGFIDYVAELMAVADLFISKPGGLSMTEALTLGVPTLTIGPLPGQEEANAAHLEAQGVLLRLESHDDLAQTAEQLLADPEARSELAARATAYAHRGTARHIAARLLTLAEGRGGGNLS